MATRAPPVVVDHPTTVPTNLHDEETPAEGDRVQDEQRRIDD